jgi:hypothetical protein
LFQTSTQQLSYLRTSTKPSLPSYRKNLTPLSPPDFRPISLCNVIYKLIAKSLADRIQPHLPNYISQAQSAFVAGRHISSNIILTQEIIHSFTLKSWASQAFLLRLDLAKAFDRLEWNFITTALNRLGFNSHFINLVSTCISSSSLSILVNDQPTSYFFPQRGLRLGCPLSPYLFVIAINELSLSLQEALTATNLRGVTLGEGAPPIHSLLFADDLILCGAATLQEAQAIHTILYDFCHQSGQTPNLNKSSIFFSCNVSDQVRNQIRTIFPVGNLIPNTMHLGHPMIFSHKDRNRAYNFIYSKFHAKFGTIKANKLNHADRLQYIKSVLSSIPVYYMSTVLFSKTIIAKINAIIRKFWWAGIQDENPTNPIALELINKSLLIHTTWNIINNKNPILSNVLEAKYDPTSTFWTATATGPCSVFWSSVLQVRHHLHDNFTRQIHAENSSIWSSPWVPGWNSIHDNLLLPVTNNPLPSFVSDLWLQDTQEWNQDILNTTFTPHFVQTINNI